MTSISKRQDVSGRPARATRRQRYREGDHFAVPLRDGGYALGVIARVAPAGKVLLGYFFGPRRDRVPLLSELTPVEPGDAALVAQFGDLGLIEGAWPVIGRFDVWNRSAWPMPRFLRTDVVSGEKRIVQYSDDNPNEELSVTPLSGGEPETYPKDGLLGAGAVEIRLTRLLPSTSQRP